MSLQEQYKSPLLDAIRATPQPAKIFAAIAAIMRDLEAVGKTSENKAQGFKFRSIDQIYNALHPLLAKHGVFSVPRVLNFTSEDRTTGNGRPMIYRVATIEYSFYADDGSFVTAVVVGEGADAGDKAFNKAMAIAHKYALFQVFTIPTEDMPDPDSESHDLAPPPPKQSRPERAETKTTTTAAPFKFK